MVDLAKLAKKCWAVLRQELDVEKNSDIPDTWNKFVLHFLQAHQNDSRPMKQQVEEFRTAVQKRIKDKEN